MGMGKGDRKELIDKLEECLEKYPPENPQFRMYVAFRFVVVDYLEGSVDHDQWMKIYQPGKTAEQLADELLSAKMPEALPSPYAGRGGRRGISRQRWNIVLDAEEVVMFGVMHFRDFEPNITMGKFAVLLQAFCKGESLSHLSQEARAFIKDSVDKLLALLEWWTDGLKGDNLKHRRALQIVAEDIVGADKPKRIGSYGKQLTKERLWSEVKKVLEHTAPHRYARAGVAKGMKSRDRSDEKKDKRFYADSRFYYATTLVPTICLFLGITQKEPSVEDNPRSSLQ